eukprot:9958841-Heterocapsa_arctica.AAC.1
MPSSRPVRDLTGIHNVLLKQCEMKEGAAVGTSPTPLLAASTVNAGIKEVGEEGGEKRGKTYFDRWRNHEERGRTNDIAARTNP